MHYKQVASMVLCLSFISEVSGNDLLKKGWAQRGFDAVCQSRLLGLLEKRRGVEHQRFLEEWRKRSNDEDPTMKFTEGTLAGEEYQLIGKEAQEKLGIPDQEVVPIRNSFFVGMFNEGNMAYVLGGNIYINDLWHHYRECPYGVKRAALYHEVVHKKYRDSTALALADAASWRRLKDEFMNQADTLGTDSQQLVCCYYYGKFRSLTTSNWS